MVHERASLRAGPIWAKTCIFCHNTIPEMDRLLGVLAGPTARPYQGQQMDGWLPEARRTHVRVTDEDAFARATADEIARLQPHPAASGGGDAEAPSRPSSRSADRPGAAPAAPQASQ